MDDNINTPVPDDSSTDSGEVESTPQRGDDSQQEAVEKQEQPSVKKYRVKLDGVEQEVDEATLIKGFQLEQVSSKRMEDARKLYDNLKPYLPIMKDIQSGDPEKVRRALRKAGLKQDAIRQMSEQEIWEHIQDQEMTPEQREARDIKRERDRLKEEREQDREKLQQREKEQLGLQAGKKIQTDIEGAFSEAKIPLKGNYRLVRTVVGYMRDALEAEGKTVSAKEVLPLVQKARDEDLNEYLLSGLEKDPDGFVKSLPPALRDGIRKLSLKEVKEQLPIGKTTVDHKTKKPRSKDDDSLREYMRRELQRG